MIGSEQGAIVSCTRRKNKPIQIDKAYFGHHGPIYAVQRNPFVPKFFLSIGDWSAKIWNEDLSNPIISTKYHNTYLTDGCWSNSRPGVFFTATMDGTMDIWDLMYRQSKPVFSMSVSDSGLQCIRCKDGKYVTVGAADGSTSLIELSDSLSGFRGDEKQTSSEERTHLSTVSSHFLFPIPSYTCVCLNSCWSEKLSAKGRSWKTRNLRLNPIRATQRIGKRYG